ncbi:MAG: hypothetical protein E7656_07660 [Ruminococcaceae bacterium]|nr:hypothetical protein [Oscillospiraceae bacterium]
MRIKSIIQKLSVGLGIFAGTCCIYITIHNIAAIIDTVSYGRRFFIFTLILDIVCQILLLIVELMGTALSSALLCGFAEIVAYAHSRTLPNSNISFDMYNNRIVELTNLTEKDPYTSKLNKIATASEKDRSDDAYYHHSVEK